MNKRGQVTVFVIIGIVLIIILAIVFVVLRTPTGVKAPQDTDELTEALQLCLEEQLDTGVAHPLFASFPTTELSKQWLENNTKINFIQNCAPIAENYPGATTQEELTTSQVMIQGPDLNNFETIRVTINFPITITQGTSSEQLPVLIAEVYENQ